MPRRSKPKRPRPLRYTIRQVDPVAYAETISTLLHDGFGPDSGARSTTFLGVSFWIAFTMRDGQEVAVGVAGMCHSAVEDGTFYLNRSYVHSDHRGHGLQRKLIRARIARARELKGTAATSDTWDTPFSANNLIECGFRAYRPANPWRSEGVMYWKLKL